MIGDEECIIFDGGRRMKMDCDCQMEQSLDRIRSIDRHGVVGLMATIDCNRNGRRLFFYQR